LAAALRERLPASVDETRVEATHDTAENRFVKAFLTLVRGIIEGVRRAVSAHRVTDAFEQRLLAQCGELARLLEPAIRHPVWRQVAPMVHVPVSSTVLQRHRGYREVFRIFVKLRLATQVALPADLVRDLLELKDAAQLYEIWSYFALVHELTCLLGSPTTAEGPTASELELSLHWGLKVEWTGKARLLYNAHFAPSALHGHRSYSVALRPDIALDVLDGPNVGWHLFDAKFRLERLDDILSTEEQVESSLDAQRSEERRGTFKRADLYKVHAYRDAIAGARSVWILYPGSEYQFFSTDGRPLSSSRNMVPSVLDGVGAIPLPPFRDAVEVRSVLAALVSAHNLSSMSAV
jgi:predicted component of viral defense system (DUF524 family)